MNPWTEWGSQLVDCRINMVARFLAEYGLQTLRNPAATEYGHVNLRVQPA